MVRVATNYGEVHEDGDVLTLELARPDKLKALLPDMIEGMASATEELAADPGPAVLVGGQGRVTTAGMDQDIVAGDYTGEYGDGNARLGELYRFVMACPRSVAVCGRGALIVADAIPSQAAEFCVLGTDVRFYVPEVSYGIASEHITRLLRPIPGRQVAA
jgi:enoyl-CoA hydratase/carnithine racemase